MPEEIENDPGLESIKRVLDTAFKFDSKQYSDSFLKRRITIRMRATNSKSYADYEKVFLSNNEEQSQMLRNLTIHVTEFFRDQSFWDFCKEKFFKDAIGRFDKQRNITIWSAGCSSGQEAISLLITFLEIDKKLKNKIRIICTDISEDILKKAKAAEYDLDFEVKGLASRYVDEYFTKNDTSIRLKDEYRDNFEFKKHDILLDATVPNVDIILLRNTVIYFSKDAKDALYLKIYNTLKTPGFFILGKTETLAGPGREKFKVYDSHERIFEKN